MRYRSSRTSNEPRALVVKYPGKCACCGGTIVKGQMATYYPDRRQIAHIGGLEGNSAVCAAEIRSRASYCPDPGELAADRWNEMHGDR